MPTKKELIIEYLKKGMPPARIATLQDIKCSRNHVYRVAKWAVENGLLEPDDTLKTCISPTSTKQGVLIFKPTGKETANSRWGPKTSRFHHIRLTFPILTSLLKKPIGKTTKLKNGVTQISFTIKQGRYDATFMLYNEKTLVVAVSEEIDAKNFTMSTELYSVALGAANYFQRNFGGKLGEPLIREQPHFALKEDDPQIVEMMADIELYDQGTSWWDRSKGFLEWETSDERLLKVKASMPECICELQDRMDKIESLVEKMGTMVEKMMKSQETLMKNTEKLMSIFDRPVTIDERRDVT